MAVNFIREQHFEGWLPQIEVGLRWNPDKKTSDCGINLDISAFLLGKNGKIINDNYLVFYNSELRVNPSNPTQFEQENEIKYPPYNNLAGVPKTSRDHWREATRPTDPDFSVFGAINDCTGAAGGDCRDNEKMNINLNKVSPAVEEIIVAVSIYDWKKRGQNFGQVESCIRAYQRNTPDMDVLKCLINKDFAEYTAVEFCRIYRKNSSWDLQALGKGYKGGLEEITKKYN